MAQVTNVKTVDTKEQKGVLVEYLVDKYGQSADFFISDGAILDGQIDSRRARSGMPVEYMSKDGKDFDWGQYSEDVEIQKRIANAFVYSFATFRKQGRGLYIYSNTKGSGKTLLACCLANEVLKKQDVSVKFTTVADYIELVRSSKNEAVKEQMNAIMNTGLLIIDDIGATKEDKTKSEEVATTEEVLEFLTSVMRGNVAEQFGLDPAITDRTKAAQLLMKRFNDDQRMNLKLTKLEIRFKESMPEVHERDNFLDALNITANEVWNN